MKNILITAGGTSEPIDGIRSITNTGTGKLGSLVADCLAKSEQTGKVFYIHAVNAVLPQSEKVKLIPVQSTDDLEKAVRKLCSEEKIDVVIHSMAVSDYTVRAVVDAETLERSGKSNVLEVFDNEDFRRRYHKLPSSMKNPVILLKQTPKILPMFREFLPDAIIVGFKLLDNVSHEELIETAHRLLVNNKCDYVLANDYQTVKAGNHEGFLIDAEKNERRSIGKQAIAECISETVLSEGKI